MKKVTLILAALALVLGITQCKKQEKPVQIGEKQHIVLTANNGNDGSKVSVSNNVASKLNLTWESTDKITASGAVEGTLDFKGEPGSATAKFEGTVTRKTGDQVVFTVGSQPNYMEQAGTLAGLKDLIHLKGTSPYEEDGEYSALMELQFAVLKLDVSALGTTGELTIATGDTQIASVADVTSSAGKEVFVAVPANGSKTEYTFKIGEKTATKNWQLKQNTFYTLDEGSGTGSGAAIVIEPAIEFIDLGLPSGTLWADRNVGAKDENAAGWFFSWGNITGYVWTGSKWVKASDNTESFSGFTSANYTSTPGKLLNGNIPVNADYDAALLYCGGNCRIPTQSEYQELLDHANWNWDSGKKGYIISDKNNPDNKIFLYAAGTGTNDGTYASPGIGHYWTSTYYSTNNSYDLRIASDAKTLSKEYTRNHGFTIRPVKPAPEKPHEYVEIGGLKWATTNIGASTPKEKGWYFSWGNTTGYVHNGSNWVTAKDGTPFTNGFTADNYNTTSGHNLTNDIPVYPDSDAARANWGGDWRMPTSAEFQALYDETKWTWDSTDEGYYITKKGEDLLADKSNALLFFPAAGFSYDAGLSYAGSCGYYWSSSLYSSDPNYAFDLSFTSSTVYPQSYDIRFSGIPIRPVHD